MKLYLKNHTERYPVEQLQLQLFAQEPSEFCTEPFTGDGTVSTLSRGKRYLTATAKVTYQGKTGFAVNRVLLDRADVRATRRILQRSYYLAALQVLPAAPPWGALSGVRPTKLSTKCLMAGGSEKDAEKLLREVYFVSPDSSEFHSQTKQSMLRCAKTRILILDSSKFDKISFIDIAPLDVFDTIVTNAAPSKAWLDYFAEHGIECLYPGAK